MKRSSSTTTGRGGILPHNAWYAFVFVIFALALMIPGTAPAEDGSKVNLFNVSAAAGPQSPSWSPSTTPIPAPIKRGFYLTNTNFSATQVPVACAKGYHTASIWELLDVSSLNYHYNHPLAMKLIDSGYGPPTLRAGWVRTGGEWQWAQAAGQSNCGAWTLTDDTSYGTYVYLSPDWNGTPGRLGPWRAEALTCDWTIPVWCVSNVR